VPRSWSATRRSFAPPFTVDVMNEARWGRDFNLPARALAAYGGAARDLLPHLQNETRPIAKKEGQKRLDALEKLIADIEADTNPKPVRSLDEFIKNLTVDK